MKVAVVGGGPAGIATLKFLATAHLFFPIPPLDVRLFEAGDEVGGTFVQRVYEDAELVSSKYLTAFSDFRLPADAPDFVTPAVYVQYLRDYLTHFGLWPHVRCRSRVTRIVRRLPAGHTVEVTTTAADGGAAVVEAWDCDAVAICTGINVLPRIPEVPGLLSRTTTTVLHSSEVKTRAQLGEGTHVVVLGAGETGMDMAHLAVTAPTASVIPTPTPGGRPHKEGTRQNKPVDTSIASLFDTAYAHPLLQRGPLPWAAYDLWVRWMHWLISGTEEVFMCKSDRALPYLSAGHRSTSLLQRLRARILNVPIRPNPDGRTITVRRWPSHVDPSSGIMHFSDADATTVTPDVVVLATGYATSFHMLDHSLGAYPSLDDATSGGRGIYCPTAGVDVAYVGFVRPSIGAIPPLAELQAQLWVLRLLQRSLPGDVVAHRAGDAVEGYEVDYKLRARAGYDLFRDRRGVDHESYAYQLALDMGAAPTLGSVLARRDARCLYAWAMGPNFNTKFRLVGPWRDEAVAAAVMRGELYEVVRRSGGAVYFLTYTVIPLLVFGTLSLVLYAAGWVAGLPSKALAACKRAVGRQGRAKEADHKCKACD
ncbi:dimethylaniline monooxygenase [Cordyceps fumosorosea ARSEF 2679]|uniref:Dimethylaniline monooxygenase n=1 Tax=Cordyceps fumosorosea (strain ARSEF 2679) TaxID=1081104 RepID=A0A162JMZ7_CORFA|nr:dimethylaniline monooxygenase [Cordyceps fumosorosea ARSEF 2679]OAA71272.1 dimethylaniline monooxygenase [Cordyceps fumosorosea ARSEF 2679]